MSFAADVKSELIEKSVLSRTMGGMRPCCIHAQMYGLFLFARDFTSSEICIKTEHSGVADLFCEYVEEITGKKPSITHSNSGKTRITIKGEAERRAILERFGHTGKEINRRMNRANIEYDCCISALLRGAFLACGTISDPEKEYHLEFVMAHKVLANDLKKLISEIRIEEEMMEFFPKDIVRRGVNVVYFKDSESIENILTFIGAPDCALEVMGMRMYKDMRNRVNRKVNFENANSSRTFNAAYREIEAIRFIENSKGLGYLPKDLRAIATLRIENEDYSLQEIADNLEEPLTKSGVNYRMKKILETAKELGWEG